MKNWKIEDIKQGAIISLYGTQRTLVSNYDCEFAFLLDNVVTCGFVSASEMCKFLNYIGAEKVQS